MSFNPIREKIKFLQNFRIYSKWSRPWDNSIYYSPGHEINRGSYMSAHVLLNLLNELGKRDKMRGLPSILSLFRNEFDNINNT